MKVFFLLAVLFASAKSLAFSTPRIGTGEYKLPAEIDKYVLDRETEVWAQVYYPEKMKEKRPIVLMLHGNHATCGQAQVEGPRVDDNCEYTHSGQCPNGYVITPNHLGYGYLAEKLAKEGVLVVSINANRGITCGDSDDEDWGLNLARGRLILKHLQILSQWNLKGGEPSSIGTQLKGKIDFSKVALVGHSRGGEGARAAFNLYYDQKSLWPKRILEPVNVRALFEIGPVDGQAGRILDAFNTSWAVLLPMCDGDVSNLEGMNPFDRMLSANQEVRGSSKSALVVWGTNHNFYNTEWLESDSFGCFNHDPLWEKADGAELQRQTAEKTLIPFLKAKLLDDKKDFLNVFDPSYEVANDLARITRIDRSFVENVDAQWLSIADVSHFSSVDLEGSSVEVKKLSLPSQDSGLIGLKMTWKKRGKKVFYEMPVLSKSLDMSMYEALSLRINRARDSKDKSMNSPLRFSLALVDIYGKESKPLSVDQLIEITELADHGFLMTLKIKLESFLGDFDHRFVRGIKFIFDRSSHGSVYVSQPALLKRGFDENLAVSILDLLPNGVPRLDAVNAPTLAMSRLTQPMQTRLFLAQSHKGFYADTLEIRLSERILVRDALPVLKIGQRIYKKSRFPKDGKTDRLLFDLGFNSEKKHLATEQIEFYYEGSADSVVYIGGTFGSVKRN